jgi:BirA family transcriptional regulator, biotin operon repressor / biotin---[acetyl-CoA-carboxylase] ligase
MEDTLAPHRVEPLLSGGFGKPYVYRETCDSTQRLLGSSLPAGALAVCDFQRAGRGRLGRSWTAPAGTAILCSILLRPPADRRASELSLLGGLAVAETIERTTGLTAEIKWPNDVLLGGRKIAGVLAEVAGETVVLGIGLNVNQRPEELTPQAKLPPTSLFALDRVERDRALLLAELVGQVERNYRLWESEGLRTIHAGLAARDFLKGRAIRVRDQSGTAIAIARDGRLEVELGGQRQLIESGEVDVQL